MGMHHPRKIYVALTLHYIVRPPHPEQTPSHCPKALPQVLRSGHLSQQLPWFRPELHTLAFGQLRENRLLAGELNGNGPKTVVMKTGELLGGGIWERPLG